MSVRSHIEDGSGASTLARVTPQGALRVSTYPPISAVGVPVEQLTAIRLAREFLTDQGGSNSMIVDGSTTPVDFAVRAEPGLTKWITGFRINVESDNFNLGSNDFTVFGAVASALANGVRIFAKQSGQEVEIAAEPIQTLGNFLNYTDSFTNLINAIGSQGDFFQAVFGFSQPIVLPSGSQDELIIRIQDNLIPRITTSVGGTMNAISQGYKETMP